MAPQSNGPVRLAIIGTRGYPSFYGGFETAVRHLVPHFAQRGARVTVYARPGISTEMPDEKWTNNVEVITTRGLEVQALSTLTYGFFAALSVLKRKPDAAIIMNVANGFWLPFLRWRGIRTIVNVDGIEWHRAKWGKLARLIFRAGAYFTAKFSDEIVVDAEAIGDYWSRHYGRDGIFVPYGAENWPLIPRDEKLPAGDYVLCVARFVPENTIDEFLDAAELLVEKVQVVLVGSSGYGGPIEARAAKMAGQYENFIWTGHVKDDKRLASLWQHCSAYFHGHSVGGTNPALVQAMACGAPVVARDTKYNREVLGLAGTFVEPDPSRMAQALLELVAAPPTAKRRISEISRERVELVYNWDSVCAGYLALALGQPWKHASSSECSHNPSGAS